MWGMLSALCGSATWDVIATTLKMPVSTTHSIVGGFIGVGLAGFGWDGVNWDVVVEILIGFVVSPIAAGIAAAIFFFVIKYSILLRENSFQKALYATPVIAFCSTTIIMFFFMYKGSPKLGLDDLKIGYKMAIVCPVVAVITGLSIFVAIPYLKRRADKMGEYNKLLDESSDVEETVVCDPNVHSQIEKFHQNNSKILPLHIETL